MMTVERCRLRNAWVVQEQLVADRANRKHIRSMIDFAGPGISSGAQVAGSADEGGRVVSPAFPRIRAMPKSSTFSSAVEVDHQVRGLDVTVDDAAGHGRSPRPCRALRSTAGA